MGNRKSNGRMTVTQAAKKVGVSPKTLLRWEKAGKTPKPKRDWRGWRVYEEQDVSELVEFHDRLSRW